MAGLKQPVNTVETPVPAWVLAPYEEKAIRLELQEETNNKCAKQFYKMGQCVADHQVLFSYYCSEQKKELTECVGFWGSPKQYEVMRAKYIEKKRDLLRQEGKQ